MLSGCVTQRRCNKKFPPAVQATEKDSSEHISSLYKNSIDNLLIYIHDSIYVHVADGITYQYIYKTLYRDRFRHDTITLTDTLVKFKEIDKTEIVTINELTKPQKFQIKAFWIMAVSILIVGAYKVARFIK